MKAIRKAVGLVLLVFCAQSANAQVGWLIGVVTHEVGGTRDTIGGAVVHLDYLDDVAGLARDGVTSSQGQFSFDNLPTGVYSVTARAPNLGFATEIVEVNERIPTHISLALSSGEGVGEYGGSLSARGVVVMRWSTGGGVEEYFLDVGNDSVLDYHLCFGSPWYIPSGDTVPRPEAGDTISIAGAPFSYGYPPMVIVHQLNGQFWRDSLSHGGEQGGIHYTLGCAERAPIRFEAAGTVELQREVEPLIDTVAYFFSMMDDSLQAYLDFGTPEYDPGNGVQRPLTFGQLHIVGGLIQCTYSPLLRVIVYEINGQFWRQPGDTTGLGDITVGGARGPEVAVPLRYLIVENYPNPFNPTTTIRYRTPEAGPVRVTIYDLTGRTLDEVVHGFQAAGDYSILWDGSGHPSGIYLCQIRLNERSMVRRMILLK
ncbi:T9SS type A sorting domain-containing protein [bacterium]|nr:T9SS type A sorting domain-containing protein [bacterium]